MEIEFNNLQEIINTAEAKNTDLQFVKTPASIEDLLLVWSGMKFLAKEIQKMQPVNADKGSENKAKLQPPAPSQNQPPPK